MPVPSTIADLDAVASNNSPAGSDSIGTSLDDYLRSHAAIIKQVSNAAQPLSSTLTAIAAGTSQLGFKNKIINGGCQVAQRGTVSLTNNAASYGGCDRIIGYTTGFTAATASLSQVSLDYGPTDYGQQVFIASSTGAGQVNFVTRLEAKDTLGLHGSYVTISAYVYQNTGSAVSAQLQLNVATALDNFTSISNIGTSTSTSVASGVVTRLTYTVLYDLGWPKYGLDVRVLFTSVPAVTSKSFSISGFQLEEGSGVTPFEQHPYAYELALCQRYAELCPDIEFGAYGATGNSYAYVFNFQTTKRDTPTASTAVTFTSVNNTTSAVGASTTSVRVTASIAANGPFTFVRTNQPVYSCEL